MRTHRQLSLGLVIALCAAGRVYAEAAPTLEINVVDELGPGFEVTAAKAEWDSAALPTQALSRTPSQGQLLKSAVAAGVHALSVELVYEGHSPVFGYIQGYRFYMRAQTTLRMRPGQTVQVTLRTYQRSPLLSRWEDRPALSVAVTPKGAMLDVSAPPVEHENLPPDGGVGPVADAEGDPQAHAKTDGGVPQGLAEAKTNEGDTASREESPGADCEFPVIHFGYARFSLSGQAQKSLSTWATCLLKSPQREVRVAGHCDVRGSAGYNTTLGLWRAQSVARFLISRGILPKRIHSITFGAEKPLCLEATEACHARNRRAEIDALQPSATVEQ